MAIVVVAVSVVGTSSFNFEKRSVITTVYWLPLFSLGREPRISMKMNLSGPVAGNNRSLCCCVLVFWLHAHNAQYLMVLFTSFTMCSQEY